MMVGFRVVRGGEGAGWGGRRGCCGMDVGDDFVCVCAEREIGITRRDTT
jgi:hypothetical protein